MYHGLNFMHFGPRVLVWWGSIDLGFAALIMVSGEMVRVATVGGRAQPLSMAGGDLIRGRDWAGGWWQLAMQGRKLKRILRGG